MGLYDNIKLVSADTMPMKEVDIFGCVRRDLFYGDTPHREMEDNSKNRYSILVIVTLKKGNISAAKYVILEDRTDSCLFSACLHSSREGCTRTG